MKDDSDNSETVPPLINPHMKKLKIFAKVVKELEETLKKFCGFKS
jgi:hypothetical protein